MNITVVGSGYVGLVAGACFAETGNDVICVDKDPVKLQKLRNGQIPIYEPGLEDMVKTNASAGRLSFTESLKDGVEKSDVIFIAVGTPQDEDGSADLTHVLDVAREIGRYMNGFKTIVDKSTVPVGTAALVDKTIRANTKHDFDVVSNPEFLKEGAALDDFLRPDRVVVGCPNDRSSQVMRSLYAPFVRTNHPILVMDVQSAELTKYAANTMLATRVSFMNEIARICERVGADIDLVRIGIGTDSRIGMPFLFPGIGYGGSCFPKDVQALLKTSKDLGYELQIARSVEDVNFEQKKWMVRRVMEHFGGSSLTGKTFAVWGLAFKPKTDDVREAPALVVCGELIKLGAKIRAYDPEAAETFRSSFGENPAISYCERSYDCLSGADALLICTEWNEFRQPNFGKIAQGLKSPLIFDGRNILDRQLLKNGGFTYYSVGRPVIRAMK